MHQSRKLGWRFVKRNVSSHMLGDYMAKRIPWSKHEIALLFMAYERVANGSKIKEQAFWLSSTLRRLAYIKGITVDDTFRNINGMNMQLANVQYLFTDGEKGLSGASREIRNMYDVYINNHNLFDAILEEATIMLNTECEINAQPQAISISNQTTSHKPIKRVPWDKYESALLFNAYENIVSGKDFKVEALKLSNTLRQYAVNRGMKIDDTYRNVNGMNTHLAQVQYLFTEGRKGLPSSSKSTREMYKLYQSNYEDYLSLLKEAIRLSKTPTIVSGNILDKTLSEHIARVESYVLKSDLNGSTIEETATALELPVLTVKKAVSSTINIIIICDRLIHKMAFVDWENGAYCLQAVLEKLMIKNNGYVSAAQLYDYAKLDMAMFMNDNNMGDQRKIFDMAEHLFSKENYNDVHYSFQSKAHITRFKESVSSKLDIIMKYARDEGGFFSEENLEEYLYKLGINNTHARQYMKLYSSPDFLFYEPGYIITAESIVITPEWLDKVKKAVDVLFSDVGDHIVIRDIQPIWYDLLPDLPGGRSWTPLLLQSILRFYYNEVGAKTIYALDTQSIETLHAMLVTLDSEIQTFSDAVLSVLVENQITLFDNSALQYSSEKLRQLLVDYGLIAGRELIYTMPEALPNDGHFIWDLDCKNVTIKL